jgi:hypothetical protein
MGQAFRLSAEKLAWTNARGAAGMGRAGFSELPLEAEQAGPVPSAGLFCWALTRDYVPVSA